MKSKVFALLLGGVASSLVAQAHPLIKQHAQQSLCSNIVALAGDVKVNCSKLTTEQDRILRQIPALMSKVLANQLDPAVVMKKLDEILAAKNQPVAILSAPSGFAIGGGTVVNPTVNNYAPPQRTLGSLKPAFVAALKQFGPHDVAITPARGSGEAIRYAAEIESAFREAGWNVVPTMKFALLVKDGLGMEIGTKEFPKDQNEGVFPWSELPAGQAAVGQAFGSIGVQLIAVGLPNGDKGATELYVGLQ